MKIPARAIVCGACRVPIISPIDPGPDDQVRCPKCGRSDRWEDAKRAMFEHVRFKLDVAAAQDGVAADKLAGRQPRAVPSDGPGGPGFRWRVREP